MSTQYIRYPDSAAAAGVPTYANVASFPASPGDGDLAIALDTHKLYEYNSTALAWQVIGGPSPVLSVGTIDSGTPAANGASISSTDLLMQSASATVPGLVNTSAQTFAGAKTFNAAIYADGGLDKSAAGTLSLGTANATTINIGNAGATVNIQGTTLYENVTQLQVTDPLITLNKGGGAGSAANSGFELEENSIITGYVETSADRNSWLLKAPNTAGEATITPGVSGIVINQSSHNPVTLGTANGLSLSTQVLSMDLASATLTGTVSTTTQTFAGAKTFTGDMTVSANLTLTGTVNSSLTGANARIPSHTNVTVTFTNASLTSIASANNGGVSSGHTLCLVNATGSTITIVNNYGGAAAGEAILTGASGDILVPNNSAFMLQYNSTASAWLCIVSQGRFMGTIDSQTKSANGAVQVGNQLVMQTADGTYPGLVSVSSQTLAGAKTFSTAPILSSLTASLPLKLDASKNITSAAINLSGSEVTSTLPIANGGTGQTSASNAFNALSPMTTAGDIIYGGASGAGTRLAVGASGKVLRSDGTNPVYSFPTPTIAAKTAAYTTVSGDDLVTCDATSAAFTITLIAAATVGTGKRYIIKKTDSSANAVTVTDAAVTINTTLNTAGESIEVYTDGSSWFILSRSIDGSWNSFTPTFTGLGTVSSSNAYWRRVGTNMELLMRFTTGTHTSVEATIDIPQSLSMDTTQGSSKTLCGLWKSSIAGNDCMVETASSASKIAFTIIGNAEARVIGTGLNNNQTVSLQASFPISGWKG